MSFLLHHVALGALATICAASASAQIDVIADAIPLESPDFRRCAEYGRHVACEGEWLFASSQVCNGQGGWLGGMVAAYKRSSDGYSQLQVLNSNEPNVDVLMTEFGFKVCGNTLVASSHNWPDQLNRLGKAFVYELVGGAWILTAGLVQVNSSPLDDYGTHVEVSEDTVFVAAKNGASTGSGGLSSRGSIYIYEKVGGVWTEIQVWSPPATSQYDGVGAGTLMAVHGNTLVWGAVSPSRIFVLERDANGVWDLAQTLPFTAQLTDLNGWAIDIDEDSIAVGVDTSLSLSSLGYVNLWEKVNGVWLFDTVLQAPDPGMHGDGFGYSVSLRGDGLLVGAPGAGDYNTGAESPGAGYLFRKSASGGWNLEYKFVQSNGVPFSSMGSAVALEEDFVLLGDPTEIVPGHFARGSASVFELPLGTIVCPGTVNSTGSGAELEIVGTRHADVNLLRLRARDLPAGTAGFFLGASASGFVQGPGGSQGNLCLGGTLYRFNHAGQWGVSGTTGMNELELDTEGVFGGFGPVISAGESWTFQHWYRDLNPGQTSNFSSAVEVLFR